MRRLKATKVVTKKMGFNRGVLPLAVLLGLIWLGSVARAQDATWTGTLSNDWDLRLNWKPFGIPTGTATFGSLAPSDVVFTSPSTSIGEINLIAGAPVYSFGLTSSNTLTFNGVGGLSINSTTFNPVTFNNSGTLAFNGGTITQGGSGTITLNNFAGGFMNFNNSSSAGNATIVNNSGTTTQLGLTFNETATGGNAVITNNGLLVFAASSTAGNATITNNGFLRFESQSTAGNAIITNGSGPGVTILFSEVSQGGQAQLINPAGATVDLSLQTSLTFTIGSLSGAGTFDFGSSAVTVGGNNLSTTISGIIADGGSFGGTGASLIKVGTGTLTLSGVNTYSGGTTIEGGTLQVSADNNLGKPSSLTLNGGTLETTATFSTGRLISLGTGGGTFDVDGGTTLTINGISTIMGSTGGLTKTGAGTLVLAALPQAYGGPTNIDAGTLEPGGSNLFSGISAFSVNANGTLDLHGFSNAIHSLSGAGLVTNNGASAATLTLSSGGNFSGNISDGNSSIGLTLDGGTLILSGNNSYSGNTTVNVGTLQAGSGTAFSSNSAFTVTSSLDLDGFNNSIASLSGSGTVTTTAGPAVLTVLNASNTTATSFSGNLIDGSSTSPFGLTVDGNGSLTLSGNNTYSGATTVEGNLVAGSTTAMSPNSAFTVDGVVNLNGFSNTIASLSGTGGVSNLSGGSATLTVGDANSTTFSGVLTDLAASAPSGALSLVKVGTGTLTLSGTNTYSGSTTVNAGVLNFTGTLTNASTQSSSVTVNSGGTLAGNGTINEPVTISNGGILAPGIPTPTKIGTLTLGSLTLNSGSILNYELGVPNQVGGTANDLIQVNGNLTLSGAKLNIANIGGFGEGVYRIFNYTGSLSLGNNGLTFGTLPTGITASDLLLQTSQAGQINLLFSATGFTDQFWDGSTTTADGTIHGGSGTWDNVTTNWTNMDATVNAAWNNGFAIFSGTAGTVTLGDNIKFNGAEFMTTGYTINAPGAQTLVATAGTVIRVDPNVTATIAAPIVDASGVHADIDKTDAGTLILTGTNTYSGGTTISGGTLQLGNGGASGSITGDVVNKATFAIDRSDSYTFAGNISGTGGFEQTGTGTVILSGNNTYQGPTTISSGILQAGSSTGLSIVSAFTVNGTLDLHGFSYSLASLAGTGTVMNNGTTGVTLTLGAKNNSSTYSGTLADGTSGLALVKTGTGTLLLSGKNTYTGGTTVSGGLLQLGDGGTNGSIVGNVVDNATLAVDRSDTYTFSGVVSGRGSFEQKGKGTTILTGNNTYLGGTTISGGTLQIGNGGTTGSITGNVTDNGTLAFDRSDTYTFGGAINGKGEVEQSGTGTVTLSGTNTYSGGTTITSGTLVVDSAQALGTGDVTLTGGVLTADPQPINVAGNYVQGPGSTLQLTIAGASAGQYDFLNVTGNASLGGTLKLINQGFTPQAGNTLILVQAGGAIANKFATFIDPFTTRPGLNTIDLVYSLHSVELEFLNIVLPVTPPPKITTINFPSFGQNPNEVAAGELLNAVELNPRFANVLNFFLAQPFGNIPGELALIGPQSFTSFYEISFSDANIQRLTLESRLDDIRGSQGSLNVAPVEGGTVGLQKSSSSSFAEASKDKDGKTAKNPVEPVLQSARQPVFDLWASGFGDFVHVDSDFNARGYRFTTSGFDLGFDYRFLDHFAVGVMGNYTYTWTDLRPGTITVNSGRGGLYAGYFSRGYYLNAGVYGGYNTYDTSRHGLLGIATGNTDGQEWSGFVSTGYDFHQGDLAVGPIASLQYTNVYINSFSETGSLVPLNIHSDSEESLRSDVGFRAEYQWRTGNVIVAPYLKATWEHEFKYSALPITAGLAGFPGPNETFYGPVEGQDSAIVSAGVSVQWTPAVSSYVGYDGQLGRDRYNSNAVRGGIRVSW